jgi:hypothetical protein
MIPEETNIKDHVYKLIELTGTSTTSIEALPSAEGANVPPERALYWVRL